MIIFAYNDHNFDDGVEWVYIEFDKALESNPEMQLACGLVKGIPDIYQFKKIIQFYKGRNIDVRILMAHDVTETDFVGILHMIPVTLQPTDEDHE